MVKAVWRLGVCRLWLRQCGGWVCVEVMVRQYGVWVCVEVMVRQYGV
jgi:hypothetical protein